jgi:hypothetical protein
MMSRLTRNFLDFGEHAYVKLPALALIMGVTRSDDDASGTLLFWAAACIALLVVIAALCRRYQR